MWNIHRISGDASISVVSYCLPIGEGKSDRLLSYTCDIPDTEQWMNWLPVEEKTMLSMLYTISR
jgi:hypothetical protein